MCLVYALTGVAVTGIAEHAGWQPLPSGSARAWVNGLAYGAIAFLVLRLRVSELGFPIASPVRILTDLMLGWFKAWLESGSEASIARKVGDLPPIPLCRASLQVFERHVEPVIESDVGDYDLARLEELHRGALAQVPATDADSTAFTVGEQERLRYYVERGIIIRRDATIYLDES
jgi:hypothetical protein